VPETSVIEKICAGLAEGRSMRSVCSEKGMPNRRTLERWMEEDADLAATIAHARKIGYDERADKAVEAAKVAEDASLGRLAFDAERWYLSKLAPKKYGDKTLIGSDPENPLPTSDPADVAARAAALMEIARRRKEGE
jgi:hypothetical protein